MRSTFRIRRKFGRNKVMLSGGLGRSGPYIYMGIKNKKGYSVGASIGTKGRRVYGSYNKKRGQIRIRHNLDTKSTDLRFR